MSRGKIGFHPRYSSWSVAILGVVLLVGAAIASARALSPPAFRLGYVATLTGRQAALGQAARDGVVMAVEECNAAGGIQGRPVELMIRDDHFDPTRLCYAIYDLSQNGAGAIIGPVSNPMAKAAIPFADAGRILLLSPSVSCSQLSDLNDSFYRVYPSDSETMDYFARYLFVRRNFRRLTIVRDTTGAYQTRRDIDNFAKIFSSLGGNVIATVEFASEDGLPSRSLADQILAEEPQCIVIIAGPLDTAILAQHIRARGSQVPIATTESAGTDTLLKTGGSAVEGLFFFQTFDRTYPSERYQAFRHRFRDRFGREPDHAAVHAYDCTRILLVAASETSPNTPLSSLLRQTRSFEGLQGRIVFTETGDARRELFLVTVRDGEFHTVH